MEETFELVTHDVRYQIEQYKDKVKETVAYVRGLSVKTKEEAERALDIACEAINLAERIENTKKEITDPQKRFKCEVDKLAKEFTKQLDEVKDVVVDKIDQWKIVNPEVKSLETSMVTTTDLQDYSFEVKDMMMVPTEYLVVDEDRIKLAMKKGVAYIPGLDLVKKTKTSIRRK